MKKLYASLFLAALLGSSFVSTVALANDDHKAAASVEEEDKADEEKKEEAPAR